MFINWEARQPMLLMTSVCCWDSLLSQILLSCLLPVLTPSPPSTAFSSPVLHFVFICHSPPLLHRCAQGPILSPLLYILSPCLLPSPVSHSPGPLTPHFHADDFNIALPSFECQIEISSPCLLDSFHMEVPLIY